MAAPAAGAGAYPAAPAADAVEPLRATHVFVSVNTALLGTDLPRVYAHATGLPPEKYTGCVELPALLVSAVAVLALPESAPVNVGAVTPPVLDTAPVPALNVNDQSVALSVLPLLNP